MRELWEIFANPRVWVLLLLSFFVGALVADSLGPWFDQQLRAAAGSSYDERP